MIVPVLFSSIVPVDTLLSRSFIPYNAAPFLPIVTVPLLFIMEPLAPTNPAPPSPVFFTKAFVSLSIVPKSITATATPP